MPVRDLLGHVLLHRDEYMRPGDDARSACHLKAAFTGLGEAGFDAVAQQSYPQVEAIEHVHTAGNSSGIVDGARRGPARQQPNSALAWAASRARRLRAFTSIGSEPTIMLTAPAPVTLKLLKRCGMQLSDIDLFEINEPLQPRSSCAIMRVLELDPARVNVNGGAIAMGHPLGATGAMILGTVLDELERRDLTTALVTLCAGNGLGTATIIERV